MSEEEGDWDAQARFEAELERRMLARWYKLDENRNVIPADSIEDLYALDREEWRDKRRVDQTFFIYRHGDRTEFINVSTVFLGLNHSYSDEGPPVVFETMLFDFPANDGAQMRYCTWNEAQLGHQVACEKVRSYLTNEGYTVEVSANEPAEWVEREKAKAKAEELRLKMKRLRAFSDPTNDQNEDQRTHGDNERNEN